MALLSKDSILLWVITSHFRRARQYRELLSQPRFAHLTLVKLKTPRETKRWLETIKPLQKEEALAKG
jgi:glutaredoxin 2